MYKLATIERTSIVLVRQYTPSSRSGAQKHAIISSKFVLLNSSFKVARMAVAKVRCFTAFFEAGFFDVLAETFDIIKISPPK